MLRVALVGDSHLTDASPRPVTKLGPRLRSMDFEVVTLACGGLDTREAIRHAPPDDVDWIVYSFGTNDAAPWKQVPPHEYERNYATLLTAGTGAAQLVLGPPPVSDRQNGRLNNVVRQYSEIAGRVAHEHGAYFVALIRHLTELDLAEDGVHLNDRGYTTIAKLVADIFRPERIAGTAVHAIPGRWRRMSGRAPEQAAISAGPPLGICTHNDGCNDINRD